MGNSSPYPVGDGGSSELLALEPDRKVTVKIHAAMGFSGTLDYILTPVGEGKRRRPLAEAEPR